MKLYQFTLPTHTNNGLTYERSRETWETHVLEHAGRFTRPSTFDNLVIGGHERRPMRMSCAQYQVMCEPDLALWLGERALELFGDQDRIGIVQLGEDVSVTRSLSGDVAGE